MFKIAAYAKINLGLEVLHKRPDGYHEINTIFSRVSLHDTITIEPCSDLSVACSRLPHVRESDNLVWKAAQALQHAYSVRTGAKITIDKHIPTGAGLGGGSSDAASALRGLVKLWNLPCTRNDLWTIARNLGADVPFFLGTTDAHATGIGDVLAPISFHVPLSVLLVFPGIEVSTPWAYAMLQRSGDTKPASDLRSIAHSLAQTELSAVRMPNDFESAVFKEHPLLPQLCKDLRAGGSVSVFMSGSGSTLVGLYHNTSDALQQSRALRSVRSCVCSFVPVINDEFCL